MSEENQKVDASLRLALKIPVEERSESDGLLEGYLVDSQKWNLIVKYAGDIKRLVNVFPDTRIVELFNQFAIVTILERYIEAFVGMPEVQFVEKPKRLYFNLDLGRSVSCITTVQGTVGRARTPEGGLSLTGKGVLVGIIDSGIDVNHPDFRDEDGKSRIAFLWDQGSQEEGTRIPIGYGFGREYSSEELAQETNVQLERGTGHGTAVAGVAAGNGNASPGNKYRGVAVESSLIVVKLGRSEREFAGSTEVMEGIDYAIQKAIQLDMPIAINLSFGTNYGPHDGRSLFEEYIAQLNGIWKNVIVIASGNEGDARHHKQVRLEGEEKEITFAIGPREREMNLQIWKEYADTFSIYLESPGGERVRILEREEEAVSYRIDGKPVWVYYGVPTPFSTSQEIYFSWMTLTEGGFVETGIWKIILVPEEIKSGLVSLWLPTVEAVGLSTGFLESDVETTLTIPSTGQNVITVGAYRAENDSMAPFSGRGNTADGRQKPTLVAPGVGVMAPRAGGGYAMQTGTSIAAPFVTGSAALLMEWGIVRGNDPYLYGEKVKAYLIKGARKLPGFSEWPNPQAGWGALCVADSIP